MVWPTTANKISTTSTATKALIPNGSREYRLKYEYAWEKAIPG